LLLGDVAGQHYLQEAAGPAIESVRGPGQERAQSAVAHRFAESANDVQSALAQDAPENEVFVLGRVERGDVDVPEQPITGSRLSEECATSERSLPWRLPAST
jgi:hypothetical protein